MSEPKNHHFVPQFYLRNFSTRSKSISTTLLATSSSAAGSFN